MRRWPWLFNLELFLLICVTIEDFQTFGHSQLPIEKSEAIGSRKWIFFFNIKGKNLNLLAPIERSLQLTDNFCFLTS